MSSSNRRTAERKLGSGARRAKASRDAASDGVAKKSGVRRRKTGDSQSPENGRAAAQNEDHEYDLGIISLVLENVGLADLGLHKSSEASRNSYSELFKLADRFAGYRNQAESESVANRLRVRPYWEACVDMANKVRSVRLSLPTTIESFACMVVQLKQQILIQERRYALRSLGLGAMHAKVQKANRGGR